MKEFWGEKKKITKKRMRVFLFSNERLEYFSVVQGLNDLVAMALDGATIKIFNFSKFNQLPTKKKS